MERELQDHLGCEVVVMSGAEANGFGEMLFGAGKGKAGVIMHIHLARAESKHSYGNKSLPSRTLSGTEQWQKHPDGPSAPDLVSIFLDQPLTRPVRTPHRTAPTHSNRAAASAWRCSITASSSATPSSPSSQPLGAGPSGQTASIRRRRRLRRAQRGTDGQSARGISSVRGPSAHDAVCACRCVLRLFPVPSVAPFLSLFAAVRQGSQPLT